MVSEKFIGLYAYIKVYEYIYVFPKILKKYRSIKMKPNDFEPEIYIDVSVEFRLKLINLRLVIRYKCRSAKKIHI